MNNTHSFVLHGHIIDTPTKDDFRIAENAYLVCLNGESAGVFKVLPEQYSALPLYDYSDRLIIPGLSDTHVHAPQYSYRGLGMDMELLEWLDTMAFPEERRYADLEYAHRAYSMFVEDLKRSATTRAAIFATVHCEGTLKLMGLLEESGLHCLVGKVSMDRNAPENVCDPPPAEALRQTEEWVCRAQKFQNTKPILTPRFIPSCTDELMRGLGELQRKYNLPVQSHLSENPREIQWVGELCPWASCYADAYRQCGLLGGETPTIMAHCVYPTDIEFEMLKANDVLISHCPASNANVISGIAPISRYLDAGMRVGLGSDVAGGFDLSVFRAMTDAVQFSKLRCRFTDLKERHITLPEAFYMGTKGGGSFFGKVGSFEEGYALDAVVLDDSRLTSPRDLTVRERLERAVYLEKDVSIVQKFVQGQRIFG